MAYHLSNEAKSGLTDIGEIKGIDHDLPFCQNLNKDGMERKIRDKIDSNLSPKPTGKTEPTKELVK